jgi:hypothetical protein
MEFSMEFRGIPWNFMKLRLMEFHGNFMEFHGIPSIDEISWNSVSTGLLVQCRYFAGTQIAV